MTRILRVRWRGVSMRMRDEHRPDLRAGGYEMI